MYFRKHKNFLKCYAKKKQKQKPELFFLSVKYNFTEGEKAKYVVQNFQILNGIYDPPKGSLF